jgi:hypothetical protein
MPDSSDLSLVTDSVGKGRFSRSCQRPELIGSGIIHDPTSIHITFGPDGVTVQPWIGNTDWLTGTRTWFWARVARDTVTGTAYPPPQ